MRKCKVDYELCFFHRWAEESWIVPPSPMVGGHGGGIVKRVWAIVEHKNGEVEKVEPERVKFVNKSRKGKE